MKAIVAVDKNWGIGYKGKLLQRVPEDMKYFKQMTLGKVVVMGRETYQSFPGNEPLKDRINIVLSKDEKFSDNRVTICRSLQQLFKELEKYPADDVYVIGGESVYRQLLPYCTEAFVTVFDDAFPSDKYFVNLQQEEAWKLIFTSETKNHNNLQFTFSTWIHV